MPNVLPLAGLRYAAPAADLPRLISPPYDVISPREADELRALASHNVVHLELPADDDRQAGSKYTTAAARARQWRTDGTLRRDARPAYYLSETAFEYSGRGERRRDVLATLGVDPWSTGTVLPHEHTMSGPKADRLEVLRATHLNISPIWVLSRDRKPALEAAWDMAAHTPPTAEFTWRAQHHRLWAIDNPATVAKIAESFAHGGPLYIADGHHRFETSLAFRAESAATLPGSTGILATVTWADDPGLIVLPTHRLLHDIDAGTFDDLLSGWSAMFAVQRVDAAAGPEAWVAALVDAGQGGPAFGIYGFGQLDTLAVLTLRDDGAAQKRLPHDRSDAWRRLDVSIVHSLILDPLIEVSGRARDDVLSFDRDAGSAADAVRSGAASAAILLNPTPVRGVLDVADAGDRMPEKSTYFWPKPPAGLVLRDLEAPA
ncbi:MAG: DUF1015 domain-containing protein [Chloroflexota bacterium]